MDSFVIPDIVNIPEPSRPGNEVLERLFAEGAIFHIALALDKDVDARKEQFKATTYIRVGRSP
jgi:hypothetical protein